MTIHTNQRDLKNATNKINGMVEDFNILLDYVHQKFNVNLMLDADYIDFYKKSKGLNNDGL